MYKIKENFTDHNMFDKCSKSCKKTISNISYLFFIGNNDKKSVTSNINNKF
jgi:hypothetical protein